MSDKKLRRLPWAAAALLACVSAQAEYQSPDGNFRLSGFGTLGVAHSSTNDVMFNYLGQGGGAGTTPNLDTDSKLAVQATYKFTPTLSATTQVMTKYDAFATYEPKVDWAFAKWQATPTLTLRGGRMGFPVFMISDFRDVGYANTTVRPPLDVYAQVPVSQYNGADATYQYSLDSATLNASLYLGDAKADYASARQKKSSGVSHLDPSEFFLNGVYGLNLAGELDNGLSFRAGKMIGKMTLLSPSITALVDGTAPGGRAAALAGATRAAELAAEVNQSVVLQGRNITFTGLGMTYDQGNWVFSGEYTKRRAAQFISSTTGWYGNVSYRLGKFTPYLGLSRLSVDHATSNAVTTTPGAPPLTQLVENSVQSGVQSLLNTQKLAQRTTTVGTRWDVLSNVAVKAQWDHVTKPANSYGLFFTNDPGDPPERSFLNSTRRVNILSLSVDVVF